MLRIELPPAERPDPRATLTFIGNATSLVRMGGVTLLTDPSFLHAGDHVHLGYGVVARRRLEPAIAPSDLPPLDAVLLSHLHGDHWDSVAQRALRRDVPIVTTTEAAARLARRGFRAPTALGRWERVELAGGERSVHITAVPARHGPPLVAALLPPTNGYVVESRRSDGAPFRAYISGDTLLYDELAEIPQRFPALDVALVHLGGTRIPSARFGVLVTLDARGGVELVRIVGPAAVIPVHTDDWSVFSSTLGEFVEAMRRAGLQSKLRVAGRGETVDLEHG